MFLDWLGRDGTLLIAARMLRAFAYGFVSFVLAIYLKERGLSEIAIGAVMTLSILGGTVFTVLTAFYADRLGRRRILILFSLLMAASGLFFAFSDRPLFFLIAAFIGAINATGYEIGPFLSIEQAVLAQVGPEGKRNQLFAFYNMAGLLATATGTLVGGLPGWLERAGFSPVASFQPLFLLYTFLGLVSAWMAWRLTGQVEGETAPLSSQRLSPTSRKRVTRLSLLFSLDAFAGGFVLQSLVAYWFYTRFDVSLQTLSTLFFVAGILTSLSFLVAARLADRIGLLETMVSTHLLSHLLLILVPLSPTFEIAVGFYLARMALSQMDVPTRQAYTVALVAPSERTAAASITLLSRSLTQAVAPSVTGVLIQSVSAAAPFFLAAGLKGVYDLLLYFQFRKENVVVDPATRE
ncbi:MAG: MFS transporter [Candidatus Manganitrophus sp.]|nr:MAG: MFS transporter [Candidatus Manganitrophus sp.]